MDDVIPYCRHFLKFTKVGPFTLVNFSLASKILYGDRDRSQNSETAKPENTRTLLLISMDINAFIKSTLDGVFNPSNSIGNFS